MPKHSTQSMSANSTSTAAARPWTRGVLALIVGAIGIGFAPLWVRSSELGPFTTAAFRLLFACPALFLWRRWEQSRAAERGEPPEAPYQRSDFLWMACAGLFFAGDMALWNWSLHLTSIANSTLITNLTPLFVMIGAWLLFKERVSRAYVLSLPLAFVGVFLLVRYERTFMPTHWKGDVISAIATLFYTGYLLSLRVLRQRHSASASMLGAGVVTCAALFLIAALSGEALWPRTPRGWLPLLALAFCSQVGGQGLIAYGFGHVTAAVGSLILLIQPVTAAALAWGFLGESMAPLQLLGGLLVLAGIAVAVRR